MLAASLLSCHSPQDNPPAKEQSPPPPTRPVIVFLGTSLTAGYGVDPALAYPALIEARLEREGFDYRVVNAGVSGETSAGALRRIDWLLRQPVKVLVVETGANDGLRGQDPENTRANIQAIIDHARTVVPPPRILLLGMQAPPNLGSVYADHFRDVYPQLARANGIPLVPFLLARVAGIPSLNQADGIHPTPEGHAILAQTVWTGIRPLLEHTP